MPGLTLLCATYNPFGVLASGVSAYKAIRSVLIIKTSEFNEYFINDLQVQWAYISIAIKKLKAVTGCIKAVARANAACKYRSDHIGSHDVIHISSNPTSNKYANFCPYCPKCPQSPSGPRSLRS